MIVANYVNEIIKLKVAKDKFMVLRNISEMAILIANSTDEAY